MPHDFMPGLAGVPAAKSAVSDVDGQAGILEYRGIRIEELCGRSSFLETTFLLWFGRLPTHEQLTKFIDDVTRHRRVKYRIVDLLKCLPEYLLEYLLELPIFARNLNPNAVMWY